MGVPTSHLEPGITVSSYRNTRAVQWDFIIPASMGTPHLEGVLLLPVRILTQNALLWGADVEERVLVFLLRKNVSSCNISRVAWGKKETKFWLVLK